MVTPYPSLAEAANALHFKSERAFRDWLRKHPQDARGEPYVRGHGQARVLTWDDVERIRRAREFALNDRRATLRLKLGHIYFIDAGQRIKIGFTRRPETRFAKMLVDAPVELRLLHIERGTFADEQDLHRRFSHLRARGEWFKKTAELLAFIEQRRRPGEAK